MDKVPEILIHKVHNYEGTVNKMTGDGIMALFGAPIALEDGPQRAIRSAIAIHKEMTKFSEKLSREREGMPPLKMRIGINTGPVVVGTIGNSLRVEFTAMGDTVNLASRMEGLAEHGTTFVTEETFKLTEVFFRFEAKGEKRVKGKEKPVKAYQVIAPSNRSTRFDVSAERGLTPLVGRQRELEILLDGFEMVKGGRGQAISLMAEAGTGKSRLLYEFRKAVSGEDATILEGKCLSYGRNVAYRPVVEILKANFGVDETDEDSQVKEKVQTGLEALQVDESSTLPYLLELLAPEASGIDKDAVSAEEIKHQMIQSMIRVMLKGAELKPLIMIFEDLHWMDKSSEEILKRFLDSIAGARVMLIFSYRPEFKQTWSGKSYHSQVRLTQLSTKESLIMVGRLLGSDQIGREIEEVVLKRSDGIPFFIEELVMSLMDLNVLEMKGDRYRLAKDIKTVDIPSTIHDVIMARVDAVPEGSKQLLQTGSVIGREFGFELIRQVTGLEEEALLSDLAVLDEAELVFERGLKPDTVYVFKHALTQKVVYDSILSKTKPELHGKIAKAMEETLKDRPETSCELLAYHYSQIDNLEKAFQYYTKAARHSSEVFAYADAAQLMETALELQERMSDDKGERCDLLMDLSDVLILGGKPRRVLDVEAPAAYSLAESLGDRQRIAKICKLALWALLNYGMGLPLNTPEAKQWAERIDKYSEPNTQSRALADSFLGATMGFTDPNKGVPLLRNGLELARRFGEPDDICIIFY